MSKQTFNKKEQFTNPQKNKKPFIVGGIGIAVGAAILFFIFGGGQKEDKNYFGDPVLAQRSYIGEVVATTKIDPVIENGQIMIPLDVVDQNNNISFEIENDEGFLVPIMVYVTPTGRIFAGSSMCEPCRGRTFSLGGETLICDTCRTTYTIEDQQFISGAKVCGEYPPVNMNPKIENNRVIIELEEVLTWRPRI